MEIQAMAAKGLNDSVLSMVVSDIKKMKSIDLRILDLGCGQGYNSLMLARALRESGKRFSILAVDLDQKNFQVNEEEVSFVMGNLNQAFSFGSFDIIIGTEIIEHLENPYFFVNQCLISLKAGGICYLSTPNIGHCFSLFKQLVVGRPMWFSVDEPSGHIMPIHSFMIHEALRRFNLVNNKKFLVSRNFNRNFFPWMIWRKRVLFAPLFGKNRIFGEINIFRIKEEI